MKQPAYLTPILNNLFHTYHTVRYLSPDPIEIVHTFKSSGDREVAGFIAASFAYGNVTQIIRNLNRILEPMGTSPADFLFTQNRARIANTYSQIRYRFNSGKDIVHFFVGIAHMLKTNGSLKAAFLKGWNENDADILPALSHFVDKLRLSCGNHSDSFSRGLQFLLPLPAKGSSCKRLNMFLRWMVRPDDGIDLGLWPEIPPSKLIIPLDTHMARLSSYIGLTKRRTLSLKMALEITESLRKIDPNDPCKYDFAITRLGILKKCGTHPTIQLCKGCLLREVCNVRA